MVGIILASGMSVRFGSNKLVAEFNNKPLVYWCIKTAKESSLDKIAIIYKDLKVKNIAEEFLIDTIFNGNYKLGQSEAIKKGVNKYYYENGFMFIQGDQPFIKHTTINTMIEIFKKENKIIVPTHNEKRGTPVIFPNHFKNELLSLQGDIGGKNIIKNNLKEVIFYEVGSELEFLDVDDMKTLELLKKEGILNGGYCCC